MLAGVLLPGRWVGADTSPFTPSTEHDQPNLPPTTPFRFHSPKLQKYVDDLPILPRRRLGGQIVAAEHEHQFHRDMAPAPSWGFDGVSHLGPVLEAHKGEQTLTTFTNNLGDHIIAEYVDTSVEGATDLDKTQPPLVIHLHGAPNNPAQDGHPMSPFRPGESHDYQFSNDLDATTLWYHDHAMGTTRLNVYAGLAGAYWIRDEFDTGADDNPLGLPAGPYEIPLFICDKIFYRDGRLRYDSVRTPIFRHHWGGGLCGDVMVVNGKAWPNMMVDSGVYRFRITSASQLNDYRLYFSNGMPFWAIGSDGGLLDAPVQVAALDVAPGERYDILVDFTGFGDGDAVELCNRMQISMFGQMPGGATIPQVMQFTATGQPGKFNRVPERLRGSSGQPAALPALPTPTVPTVNHTLNVSLNRDGWLMSWLGMNIDNLPFGSPDTDIANQGSVQQWNLINADATIQTHSIHIHLVQFRVLGRQNYDHPRYAAAERMPFLLGKRWNPSVEPYVTGPLQPPAPYEAGWKDTVRCPRGQITRVLIRWPTEDELGFDPDAAFTDSRGRTLQGYVWHCHMLDHEDNVMMRNLRVIDSASPNPAVDMSMDHDPAQSDPPHSETPMTDMPMPEPGAPNATDVDPPPPHHHDPNG